ncbi:hypothetical protein LTS18_011385 [Coniosporium uncinatum]|uniref:Uncharacterized protein n=1 Tax=Coniosporium uncinatum TaxID=93489 RepID=A0ACC3DK89_9PEZI|nr:hypothetical protein LTS18_011385 [Coniosporium uncinatum]
MAAMLKMVQHKWFPPPDPTTSFAGKTIIVTGASSGLGFEAALKFVQLDASKVILACRSRDKGLKVQVEIEARTKKTTTDVWDLDMDSYDSVRAFADRVNNDLERLDGAVLNAGLMMTKYKKSDYGWEETIQVNVLSTVLLSLLLLPKLKKSVTEHFKPTLEFVSSGLHRSAQILPEARDSSNTLGYYSTQDHFSTRMYGLSKLFLMYAMKTMAAMTADKDGKPEIVVMSVCPGACQSDLGRGYEGAHYAVGKWVFGALMTKTAEAGARSYISGLLLGDQAHGRFWQHDVLQP